MEEDITIYRPATSDCVAIDLAHHGYLPKTPMKPEVAIGFRTLELFHRVRLRKASLSVEAFTRVICDYYEVVILSARLNLLTNIFLFAGAIPEVPSNGSRRNLRNICSYHQQSSRPCQYQAWVEYTSLES